MNIPEEMRKPKDRLDGAIADVAYILDSLIAYRNIVQTGDCNNCAIKGKCKYCPKPVNRSDTTVRTMFQQGHKACFKPI